MCRSVRTTGSSRAARTWVSRRTFSGPAVRHVRRPGAERLQPTDSARLDDRRQRPVGSIPLRLHPDYVVSPFKEIAAGNTPPILQFAQNGPSLQGPVAAMATAVTRTASWAPLRLTLWASDDGSSRAAPTRRSGIPPPVGAPLVEVPRTWRGDVRQISGRSRNCRRRSGIQRHGTATATFSEPGDYVLHVTANDYSGDGGGGFQCCWTTALVKVAVK